MRVAILSASTGQGHTSASIALEEELVSRGAEVLVLDTMDYVSPVFRQWFKGGYEALVRKAPWLWGHLYRTSDRKWANYRIQTFLDNRFCKPMDEIIREFKPDVVLCTHSVVQPRLPELQKELGFLFAVVVTDIHPHLMWLRGEPDLYFCATDQSVDTLKARTGLEENRFICTGIPINSVFRESSHAPAEFQDFNLDASCPIIVLSSGGIGGGPFENTVELLSAVDAQIVVLCGKREELASSLSKKFSDSKNLIFQSQIPQKQMGALMGLATLLIGKSGGLTTFEALACGCPFLILEPFLIPGQEEDNAKWLEEIGAGKLVQNVAELPNLVQELLEDPKQLSAMRESALRHARPDAAKDIVTELFRRIGCDEKVKVPTGQYH